MKVNPIDSDERGTMRRRADAMFAAAVFMSAFLLFQVQPLISKAILPWFGGTPGVWTTCMLFFQLVLFGGYAYAHLVSSRLSLQSQAVLHVVLIGAALVVLKVLPDASWKPTRWEPPALRIVLLLTATVGLPYFLLSTSGPLLQRWFSLIDPGRSPYRLYALSNAGSLIALLSYPFVFEPALTMATQARIWTIGFWFFAALCMTCAVRLWRTGRRDAADTSRTTATSCVAEQSTTVAPTLRRHMLWFALAMIASTMYLATTNQVCQDVAVIPFLWVAPLSLYLLSFILCFESDRWYRRRRWWALATSGLVTGVCWVMLFGTQANLAVQVIVYFAAMFAVCMICHGELSRMRPDPQHLTDFFLTLSAGGAGGGVLVAVVAPAIFPDVWEMYLALTATVICVVAVLFDETPVVTEDPRRPLLPTLVSILLLVVVGIVSIESVTSYRQAVSMTRNFYGVLEVAIDDVDDIVVLRHGQIIHGLQLRTPGQQMTPTSYYSRRTGVGRALEMLQSRQRSLRIGLVGLGVGTLAAYGRQGDVMRFYEINEDVVWHARNHFTFMERSPATVETIIGDARMSLTAELPQDYDLLVLDAFAGDAIPTHLLTREAFAEYLRHIDDNGIIAVHTSNLHFDLRPVTDALAGEYKLHALTILVPGVHDPVDPSSEWVLMTRNTATLAAEILQRLASPPQPDRVLWTDNYSNLFEVWRR